MPFHVGQRVVCVRDDFNEDWVRLVPNRPRRGRIYTIRARLIWCYRDNERRPGVLLAEVVNVPHNWFCGGYGEVPFREHRFRPITERPTDITVFTKMLTGVQEDEPVGEPR